VRRDSLSGFELQEHLERIGIFPELADPYQVLLILPLVKQGMSFPLEEAIDRFHQLPTESLNTSKKDNILLEIKNPVDLIELSYSYKEMLNMPYEWVYIQQSVGRIAAKMIIPYPPGIPLFLPGEKITNEHIIQFQKLIQAGARFQGVTGLEKIAVF